jgi:cytoskeletal protein RodZ
MTTRDHARPVTDRDGRAARPRPEPPEDGPPGGSSTSVQSLPERLVAARERKGVDLYRAERDTKIRAHYLAALERGDYRELPGSVYTKGFLRNYALYLGLDPDDVLLQWRAERGEAADGRVELSVPKPLTEPRRAMSFSPGVLVAALLTLAIVAFVGYLGIQLFRFAKPPTISVTAPAVAVLEVEDGISQYTFSGMSIAGATIEITASGKDQPYRTTADPDGSWSQVVTLSRGRNEFSVSARDPDTGKPADAPVQRVITVPFPVIEAPTLSVDSPTDGATYQNGAVPVSGRTTNATTVTVTATWVGGAGPSPSAAPSPSAPPAPAPQEVTPADDGTFNVPVELTTGRWSITVTAASADGKTVSIARSVTISYNGVNLVVTIKGGRAWLKAWVDGKLDPGLGAAGKVLGDGKSVTFAGKTSVEVRTGNSGVTTFTLNGQSLGSLGKKGVPETWLFAPPDPPKQTGRT